MRSRSIEYQGKLLQDFSKEAMGKVFAKAKGEEGLDLVIHKVRLHLVRSLARQTAYLLLRSQVFDWKDIKDAHTEMEQAKNIGKIVCEIKS